MNWNDRIGTAARYLATPSSLIGLAGIASAVGISQSDWAGYTPALLTIFGLIGVLYPEPGRAPSPNTNQNGENL